VSSGRALHFLLSKHWHYHRFQKCAYLISEAKFYQHVFTGRLLYITCFFSDELTKYKLQKAQVYYGSFLFALASMISVVLISIPVTVSLFFHHHLRATELYGVLLLSVLVILFIYAGYGLNKKKGFTLQ
jgi:hypothetical protein